MSSNHGRFPIRAELARLIRDLSRVTTAGVWRALTQEERRQAIGALLQDGSEARRRELVEVVASHFHFRKQTVNAWSASKIAERAARIVPDSFQLLADLLVSLHLRERSALVTSYLDHAGVEHEGGRLPEGVAPDLDEAAVRSATEQLLEEHSPDWVATYLLSLRALGLVGLATGTEGWLADTFVGPGDEEEPGGCGQDARTAIAAGDALVEDESSETSEPATAEDFTTLDRQLVRTIVDVAQGVEGSLDEDELVDLVEELIQLNSDRHRSYFHAGFSDVVLARGIREELPAQNESRLQWYWAGYVSGLARLGRWEEIVVQYDEQPAVRALGGRGQGPASPVVRHIFSALCRGDRPTEATRFVQVEAIVRNPLLFREMNEQGTRLLRQGRAADARRFFDLLWEAVRKLIERGYAPSSPAFLEVRRRRAHCFRQLGEMEEASRLLEDLLEEESDPSIRAMVFTDLGLIDAGFRGLASLRLPVSREDAGDLLEELQRGEARFRESAVLEVRHSAHGCYCIGMLEFLSGNYAIALKELDVAVSLFSSNPERYEEGGLLATARMALAVSICLALERPRMRHAVDLLHRGLDEGLNPPSYLLPDIIAALEIGGSDLARRMAEVLVKRLGDSVLDDILRSESGGRSGGIVLALHERAEREGRGDAQRAADYRKALPLLLRHDMHEEAASALDHLEAMATRGVDRVRYLDLLDHPPNYEPLWESTDALWSRVRVLESAGRYEDAFRALEVEFHQLLGDDGFGAGEEAEAVLERIEEYGLGSDRTAHLRDRLSAYLAARGPAIGERSVEELLPVKVLFVGGDERQERYGEAIKEELKEKEPTMSVTLVHPGWSGNWSGSLEDVRRKLPSHDGIVISRFVRTEFGRQLRKSLDDIPWRPCGGSGKQSMVNSILLAAEAARDRLRRMTGGPGD